MSSMRKSYTSSFKTQIVVQVLRGQKSLAQIAAEHQLHPNLIAKWRDAALVGMRESFEQADKVAEAAEAQEKKIAELYEQIGRLSTQVNWLKKKSGLEPESF